MSALRPLTLPWEIGKQSFSAAIQTVFHKAGFMSFNLKLMEKK